MTASFLLEKNGDVAAQEVRDAVNRVMPQLPETIRQPTVQKMDPDASPILTLVVSSKRPVRDTTEFADKTLRRALENVNGVGQVLVVGGRQRQINVWLDAGQLRAQNVTVTDVSRALQAQNIEIPGGRIENGPQWVTVRTRGRVQSVAEFNDIVVRQRDTHPITVADVAVVEDGMADPTSIANLDGVPAVTLQIRRQSGTNVVEVVDAVLARVRLLKATLPPGYDVRVVRDQSEYIKASIGTVKEHLILGSILAALVVAFFLWNLRSTLIAAIAIPTSIISTFGLIWYMGFTLNSMTMLALTLSVGIVIDDAIVVIENIYRFIEEKGRSPIQAAVEATREIGLAVLATTLSLIAIFLPMGFMGGIVGRFMQSFGLTMSFAVAVSLLVSFTLTPMLGSRWLRSVQRRTGAERHTSKDSWFFHRIDARYTHLLQWALSHRGLVVAIGFLVLLTTVPLGIVVHKNFMPLDDQSDFLVEHPRVGGHEPSVHRDHGQPRGYCDSPARPRVAVHARDGRQRHRDDAEPGLDLREAEAGRSAHAQPVRDSELGSIGAAAEPCDRHADVRPAVVRHGRRRRGHPVRHQRAGSEPDGDLRGADCAQTAGAPGRGGRGHVAQPRQARALRDAEPPKGGGPRRPGERHRWRTRGCLWGATRSPPITRAASSTEVHLRARAEDRTSELGVSALTVPSTRLGSVPLENLALLNPVRLRRRSIACSDSDR